jgi:hypothetical protein
MSLNQEAVQDVLDFYIDKVNMSDDRYDRIINRANAGFSDSFYPPLTLLDIPSDLAMFLAQFESHTDRNSIVIIRSKPGSVDLSAKTEDIIITLLLSYSHDDIIIPSVIWEKYNIQHTGKSSLISTLAGGAILNINTKHRLRRDRIYKFRMIFNNRATKKCFELDGYISNMKKADMIAKITSMRKSGELSISDKFNKFYGYCYCDEAFIFKYDESFEEWNSQSMNSILNGISPCSTLLVTKEVEEENLHLDDEDEIDLISIEIRDPVTNVLI